MAFESATAEQTPFPPPDMSSPSKSFENFSFIISISARMHHAWISAMYHIELLLFFAMEDKLPENAFASEPAFQSSISTFFFIPSFFTEGDARLTSLEIGEPTGGSNVLPLSSVSSEQDDAEDIVRLQSMESAPGVEQSMSVFDLVNRSEEAWESNSELSSGTEKESMENRT